MISSARSASRNSGSVQPLAASQASKLPASPDASAQLRQLRVDRLVAYGNTLRGGLAQDELALDESVEDRLLRVRRGGGVDAEFGLRLSEAN